MHYDPRTEKQHDPFDLLQRCTGPRPIAWLSSVDKDGHADLSVFTHWQWLSPHSPVILFSASQSADGQRATTVTNAEDTGWFVWNMPTAELQSSVELSMRTTTGSTDSFQHAGVGKAPSITATCPRVAQSPAHLECRYLSTQRIPSNIPGHFVDLVMAEVARIHIKDELLGEKSAEQLINLQPLLQLGEHEITALSELNIFAPVASN